MFWKETEAWMLSLLSVLHNQCPDHAHLIMYAEIKEQNKSMARYVVESQMQEFLYDLDGKTFTYLGEEIYPNVFSSTDWIAVCRELDAPLPNTPNLFVPTCFRCGVNKEYLCGGYLVNPFQWHDDMLNILDFPNAVFDEFTQVLLDAWLC